MLLEGLTVFGILSQRMDFFINQKYTPADTTNAFASPKIILGSR